MEDLSSFSSLVERIYDASLDAALWPGVLEQTCGFVEGCSIALYYKSFDASMSLAHDWGQDPHYIQLYQDKYAKVDPFYPAALFLEVGKVHTVDDMIPIDEFRATQLYKEWVRPQGLLDAAHANLERTATGAAAVVIHRRERDGLFDSDAKARLALLVPHVQRAIAIGKVVEFHQANQTALAETIEHLGAAILLVAQDGRLVHLNAAGNAMLTAADTLRAPQGRLVAVSPRADKELQEAIARASRGDDDLGVKGVAIALAAGDPTSQVAHVLSLASGKRRGLLPGRAVAAVFVRQMTEATPTPFELLAQAYGLTAAEVRVLAALAASTGVAGMARTLGVGEATVKSHLQRLFAKTGAKRQADLLKLLARHGSPLSL